MNWLNHVLGTDGGAFYHFYSGFGTAVGSITLLGGLFTYFQQRQCHVDGCRRRARQTVPGSDWKVCNVCHPDGPLTHDKIHRHVASRHDQRS